MRAGTDLGGIRTLADLLGRCIKDDETGCLVINAPKRRGSHYVWMPVLQKSVAIPSALALLMDRKLNAGQRWVPRCGNTGCCNPDHRFAGKRSDLVKILRPTLDPLHSARIGAAHRARAGSPYSVERHAEIMGSAEPSTQLADRLGMTLSHVCRIRRGEAWRMSAASASAFTWRP